MILKRAAEIKLLNEVTLPRAIDNLLHAQVQHRKTQDKAHNVQIETLKVGSKVMLWDPKIKGKLAQRKSGPYLIEKISPKDNYFLTNCKTNVTLKNSITLRRLQAVVDSVTEFDETLTTNYDIIKIISTRGQEPNVEFLVEWKNKPKDKKTWVLESNLKTCPDQINTNKLLEAYKTHLSTRMTTRQTGRVINNALIPLIMLILLFLPLISAGEVFGNFKFCSISKNSKILNYEHNCQLMDTNPIYKTKNFTILEKRQHMIDGVVHACWAETIWVRSWRMWFFFPAEERLTPQRILLSVEQCWNIINNRVIFDQKLTCDNSSYCVSYVEPIVLDYPHIGYTYYKSYHIISSVSHIKKESLFKPMFDKHISSCLPKDFFCIAGESTYVWNDTIVHNCEFFKVKTISLRGTDHVLFSNNSLLQISKTFTSCGIEIFATSQGLYLSENIIASNFSSEPEDLNLEHHLIISDFDKKIFDLFGFITKVYLTQRLNFCLNKIKHIHLLQEKLNEFGIVQDFNSREIVVFNLNGDLIVASCVNITSISFNHSSKDCFSNIPVLGHAKDITFKGFLFNHDIISNLIFKSDCNNIRIIKLRDSFKLIYSKGVIELSNSGREPLKLNLINQMIKNINFEHDPDVILDLKEENQGKIIDFSDKDFFIPPLIDHSNTSFINLEKFVTLIETVKWNPLTWDFFADLSHILKVGLSICVGLFVILIIGVLVYFSVRLTIYLYSIYKDYMVKKQLKNTERELVLPFIQTKVLPNIIPPIVMPLNLNKTPVYASPVRRRSSAEFNALINNFENLKRISIFDSQKFKNSILESP